MKNSFTTIALIGKYADSELGAHLQAVADYLQQQGRRVVLDRGTHNGLSIEHVEVIEREQIGRECDLAIVMGGDGTLLNAARSLAPYDVPLVGINRGRLGFLTDIHADQFTEKLGEILAGRYQCEERLLLRMQILRDDVILSENIAFNDVVVHKWEEARMLEFETFIDGAFVNSQRSDGLIIATPTGSTAYALSGGGPILQSSLNAIVMVPICPHTLSLRPLCVSGDSRIEIVISESGHARSQVTCDGQINLGLIANDRVLIQRYDKTIRLLHPEDYNYFEILRRKLRWGEKL